MNCVSYSVQQVEAAKPAKSVPANITSFFRNHFVKVDQPTSPNAHKSILDIVEKSGVFHQDNSAPRVRVVAGQREESEADWFMAGLVATLTFGAISAPYRIESFARVEGGSAVAEKVINHRIVFGWLSWILLPAKDVYFGLPAQDKTALTAALNDISKIPNLEVALRQSPPAAGVFTDTVLLKSGETLANVKATVTRDSVIVTDARGNTRVLPKDQVAGVKTGGAPAANNGFADTVLLKSGETLTNVSATVTRDSVVVTDAAGNRRVLPKDQVVGVRKGE